MFRKSMKHWNALRKEGISFTEFFNNMTAKPSAETPSNSIFMCSPVVPIFLKKKQTQNTGEKKEKKEQHPVTENHFLFLI